MRNGRAAMRFSFSFLVCSRVACLFSYVAPVCVCVLCGRNGVDDEGCDGPEYGERAEDVFDWFGDDDAEFAVFANEVVVFSHALVVGAAVTTVTVVFVVPFFGGDAPVEGLFLVLVSAALLICSLVCVCGLVCGVADAVDVSLRAVDGSSGLFHRVDEFSLLDVEEGFVRHGFILSRVGAAVLACARVFVDRLPFRRVDDGERAVAAVDAAGGEGDRAVACVAAPRVVYVFCEGDGLGVAGREDGDGAGWQVA